MSASDMRGHFPGIASLTRATNQTSGGNTVSDLRLALVGFGKIATTRHLPAIASTAGVALAAIADPKTTQADVAHFASLDALLRDGPAIDAVVLCTPPQVRTAQARLALAAGKHVMLEKPPGATVSEIAPLVAAAKA